MSNEQSNAERRERFALIDVGCLECAAASQLLGVYDDEFKAFAAFYAQAEIDSQPVVQPIDEVPERGTAIALAGHGGSYWYPLQLHRVSS